MTGPKLVRTMCPMNCHPTFCGMLVEVDDGKLKTVSGNKDNPDSQGFLCVRGRSPTRSLAIQDGCSTLKFVMIAARIPGAERAGMRRWISLRSACRQSGPRLWACGQDMAVLRRVARSLFR